MQDEEEATDIGQNRSCKLHRKAQTEVKPIIQDKRQDNEEGIDIGQNRSCKQKRIRH